MTDRPRTPDGRPVEAVMTMDEFMQKMEAAFPGSTVEEHPSGELVIYTGLREDAREGVVVPWVEVPTTG